MFGTPIVETAFTSTAANNLFPGINGQYFSSYGDVSFLSTARALLANRIGEEDHIYIHQRGRTADNIYDNDSAKRLVRSTFGWAEFNVLSGSIIVENIQGQEKVANNAIDLIEKNFIEQASHRTGTEWEQVHKVTEFYRKSFKCLCFISREMKCSVIIGENISLQRYHYIQCSLFALMPWYFDPKEGVSPLEMELIQSLREPTESKYIDALNKLAEQYNFRDRYITDKLKNFEAFQYRAELHNNQESLNEVALNIEDLNNQILRLIARKRSLETVILGLHTKISENSDTNEIMDYFLTNKSLYLREVSGVSMVFVVKGFIEYYDEDMAETVINNPQSYCYSWAKGEHAAELADGMKRLMKAVFIDRKLKIRTCTAFSFNDDMLVSSLRQYQFGADCDDAIPNPHANDYSCLGDYRYYINECLKNYDYIGAIEQCCASNASLNFHDYTVMDTFMGTMYNENDTNYGRRCIVLPSGETVRPEEAIRWLYEQEEKKEEDNESGN